MPYSLTWLPTVLKNAGLKVAEVPGWTNRGHGDIANPLGVILHHTAGPKSGNMPSLRVITEGRADLSGPLAQLGLGRDGTFYIVAAGLCYHAGPGAWAGITAGNSRFIGIEAENVGTSADPWPSAQLDALRHGVAAILDKLGRDQSWCCGHKEWAPSRKIDPHSIDMNGFRSDLRQAMLPAACSPCAVASRLVPAMNPRGLPTIRRGGDRRERAQFVKAIQSHLGFPDGKQDGVFGPITEAAVREFQRQHGLIPDGIVGPKTWDLLIQESAQ